MLKYIELNEMMYEDFVDQSSPETRHRQAIALTFAWLDIELACS